MGVEILIPKESRFIANRHPRPRSFRAPDNSLLHVHVPINRDELAKAWIVLEDYTRRMASNPESPKQDLDDISDVHGYHFGDLGYAVFTAVDGDGKPQVVAPAEITLASRHVRRRAAEGRGIGFIYQIAHTSKVSNNDRDFLAATKLYRAVAGLLKEIAAYDGNNWLGVVTESRNSGPELEAILAAGFRELVPNEQYRPPAVQKVRDPKNRLTKDLVLLGLGVPKDLVLRLVAAEAYVRMAYCEGQNIKPTLALMKQYFSAR